MQDLGDAIREQCLKALPLADENKEDTKMGDSIPGSIVSQQENTSSKTGDILNAPAKLRL